MPGTRGHARDNPDRFSKVRNGRRQLMLRFAIVMDLSMDDAVPEPLETQPSRLPSCTPSIDERIEHARAITELIQQAEPSSGFRGWNKAAPE